MRTYLLGIIVVGLFYGLAGYAAQSMIEVSSEQIFWIGVIAGLSVGIMCREISAWKRQQR